MFCKRLIKWTLIGGVGAAASGLFLFGDHAFSYLNTAADSIREEVSDQIPLEFELRRADALIREIEPQITEGKRQVAQAEVELSNLETEVARLENAVERGESKLRTVTAKYQGKGNQADAVRTAGFTPVKYAGYRVELDLERTFEVYKNNMALLEGKRALIERQAKAVTAARLHLDAVRSEKAKLVDLIATLKTQKKQLDALAASSRQFELDDSALGRAKEVLAHVKKRLDVQQRLIEDDIYFESGGTHSDEGRTANRDIVGEIREFFGDSAETAVLTVPVR